MNTLGKSVEKSNSNDLGLETKKAPSNETLNCVLLQREDYNL